MEILIATLNPFGKIGGGETFYRELVRKSPSDNFFFFESNKNFDHLPQNVRLLRRKSGLEFRRIQFSNRFDYRNETISKNLNQVEKSALRNALMIVNSIKDITIDHIHIPEYELVGPFLKLVLQKYGKPYITTSTFIHGGLSQTIRYQDYSNSHILENLSNIEREQRESSDQVFAFSSANLAHIQSKEKFTFIDPALLVQATNINKQPSENLLEQKKPILILAGRYEKVKGIERILNLYPYLAGHFSDIQYWNNSNSDQDLQPLMKLASLRGFKMSIYRPKKQNSFFAKFPENGLLVIPSLFDNLNLMAFEAISLGIPVVISKEAGASNYFFDLDHNYEKYIFDPNSPVSIISTIVGAAENLQTSIEFSKLLSDKLLKMASKVKLIIDFSEVPSKRNTNIMEQRLLLKVFQLRYYIAQNLSSTTLSRLSQIKSKFTDKSFTMRLSQFVERQFTLSTRLLARDYLNWLKINFKILAHIKVFSKTNSLPIIYGRDRTFMMTRNQAILNQDYDTALTYELRLIREESYWSGPKFSLAIELAKESNNSNVLQILTGGLADEFSLRGERSDITDHTIDENRRLGVKGKLFTDDKKVPILEIIVSSYMARDKLSLFLTKLSMDELVKKRDARIIFIDAASPQQDFQAAFSIAEELGIAIKSFQMHHRISIQEAWNFGILESDAPYLVFLGTDEAAFPGNFKDALAELTNDEQLDWITFSSFATEVDSCGNYLADKMFYDRSDYVTSLEFLDSSYINFVGGVLRSTVFKRFGLFDGRYSGAGDTEFKSRVLPHIKVACHEKIGGQFFDYPEQRTTASKKSEIEDFGAWYYYRNSSALKRLVEVRPNCLLEIYEHALSYRKSYAQHKSTDVFLAARIIEVLPGTHLPLASKVLKARNLYRKLYSAGKWDLFNSIIWTMRLSRLLRTIRRQDEWSQFNGVGAIRLDNSIEQHGWMW